MKTGRFVWYEVLSPNVEAAIGFYTQLFGWKVQPFEVGDVTYPMFTVNGVPIGGALPLDSAGDDSPYWSSSLKVNDVDKVARFTLNHKGKQLIPPSDMPGVGRMAVVADPTGAILKLFTPERDMPQADDAADYQFAWNELMTADVETAKAYYTEVAGWRYNEMNLGDLGVYTLVKTKDEDSEHAGIMTFIPGLPHAAQWLPYVRVPDIDRTVAKLEKLGGEVVHGVQEVKGVGRMAIFKDSQGALLAAITPDKNNG